MSITKGLQKKWGKTPKEITIGFCVTQSTVQPIIRSQQHYEIILNYPLKDYSRHHIHVTGTCEQWNQAKEKRTNI